jgi:hypothetical protein
VVSCPNDLICLVVKYECSHSSFTRVKLCLCKIVFRTRAKVGHSGGGGGCGGRGHRTLPSVCCCGGCSCLTAAVRLTML